jgi:splicing factor 3A subunit 3
MLLEDQRLLHEDLERLEDAAADLLLEDPPHASTTVPTCRITFVNREIDSRPPST